MQATVVSFHHHITNLIIMNIFRSPTGKLFFLVNIIKNGTLCWTTTPNQPASIEEPRLRTIKQQQFKGGKSKNTYTETRT